MTRNVLTVEMRTFVRSRGGRISLLLGFILFALAVVSLLLWGEVTLLVGALLLAAMIVLTAFVAQSVQRKLHKDHKYVEQKLKNLEEMVRQELQAGLRKDLNKMSTVLSNTAGSTGRSAPIIRHIDAKIDQLVAFASSLESIEKASKTVQPIEPVLAPAVESPARTKIGPRLIDAELRQSSTRARVTAMVVADEFTSAAFAVEWNQLNPTPDNWRLMLDGNDVDLLLIESAWEANGGSWRYHLVGQSAPRPAVIELVNECRARSIPVVFWNKEDPPHFEDFFSVAELADFVFTTEGAVVEDYKRRLGHENVAVLPFAAQPALHNPARLGDIRRTSKVVFGGMYFQHKYPERREQMEYLLPSASKVGLDIYSRQSGGAPEYQFPAEFQKDILPQIPYSKMVAAYHAYKVVLNVNSVPASETMCARRIFEATACGAAVVSPPTAALENFFPKGLITTVSNEKEAYVRIRALERSDEYRERLVHQAQREIWRSHTYRHRIASILESVDKPINVDPSKVSVVITTNRPQSIPYLVKNVVRQNYPNFELVLLTHGFLLDEHELQPIRAAGIPIIVDEASPASSLGANLNRLTDLASGDILVRMDDDDWYGESYILDSVHALNYSGAGLVGKAATYIYFEATNSTILTYSANEHRYTDFIRGATFVGSRELFKKYRYAEIPTSEDSDMLAKLQEDGVTIYAADRFNFVVNRWSDKNRHTWSVSDDTLFATGELKFFGNGQDQVQV